MAEETQKSELEIAVFEPEFEIEPDDPLSPRPKIDIAELNKLASLQCSPEEAAAYLNVDPDEFEDHFGDYFRRAMKVGLVNIRQWQMSQAQAGNIEMLKWLGQQYLKQSPPQK